MIMLFAAVLMAFLQVGSFSLPADSALDSEEKLKIQKIKNVDGRIKIYRQASERFQKSIEASAKKDNFQAVSSELKLWTSLLSESLKDIEANLKSKKKSKNLIRYEIQVRKAISSFENYKVKAPADQTDLIESCLNQAETIRIRFVDILFKRE